MIFFMYIGQVGNFYFIDYLSLVDMILQKLVGFEKLMIKKSICFCYFKKMFECLKLEFMEVDQLWGNVDLFYFIWQCLYLYYIQKKEVLLK